MTTSVNAEIILAEPRGFCAGVDRAIDIVEHALEKFGAPIYVRHEIVHNTHVVEDLRARGAIFIEDLNDVPPDATLVFSAHGVPKEVEHEAARRGFRVFDATCPLVTKVHRQAEHQYAAGRHVVLIGHKGHVEVIGTMGQLPEGAVTLVETVADVARLSPPDPAALAYATQTTLSVDDTAEIIAALRARFPAIAGPAKEDICYATTNRQGAVKAIAARCDALIVVGAPNSSNSQRLVDVARSDGCTRAFLVQRAAELDPASLDGIATIGITAGASAPEELVEEVLAKIAGRFDLDVEDVVTAVENIAFNVPRELRDTAAG
jgi:4-hydroxy-3-methylbut-2-enyl diphosphate reductase